MRDGRTVSRREGPAHPKDSDEIQDSRALFLYSRIADTQRDTAPCASGAHCVCEPPTRVAYRGDVCAGCRGVRAREVARLRAAKR